MAKVYFHWFQVHHFNNVLEQFLCYIKDGAMLESRFKYILTL